LVDATNLHNRAGWCSGSQLSGCQGTSADVVDQLDLILFSQASFFPLSTFTHPLLHSENFCLSPLQSWSPPCRKTGGSSPCLYLLLTLAMAPSCCWSWLLVSLVSLRLWLYISHFGIPVPHLSLGPDPPQVQKLTPVRQELRSSGIPSANPISNVLPDALPNPFLQGFPSWGPLHKVWRMSNSWTFSLHK
jgi:hypothetical protein